MSPSSSAMGCARSSRLITSGVGEPGPASASPGSLSALEGRRFPASASAAPNLGESMSLLTVPAWNLNDWFTSCTKTESSEGCVSRESFLSSSDAEVEAASETPATKPLKAKASSLCTPLTNSNPCLMALWRRSWRAAGREEDEGTGRTEKSAPFATRNGRNRPGCRVLDTEHVGAVGVLTCCSRVLLCLLSWSPCSWSSIRS
mmetsp:Transcript_3580/g.12557  ORF Transcript_3580/g.12557 Transcript_3580/m.12557 type:complete len:203 (-) Transcript_3580:2751-3359(-)